MRVQCKNVQDLMAKKTLQMCLGTRKIFMVNISFILLRGQSLFVYS